MDIHKQFGYFYITITNESSRPLFDSNNERAFIMSFLQHALSMRTIIEGPLENRSLAAHIDLLAFSLTRSSCQLVLFGISRQSVDILCRRLCTELQDYNSGYGKKPNMHFSTSITTLSGPHDALHQTTLLHRQHHDWEYDRYSSIGFYLHDRRGDWVRLWRVARLYEYEPEKYRLLMKSTRPQSKRKLETAPNPSSSSSSSPSSLQIINAR